MPGPKRKKPPAGEPASEPVSAPRAILRAIPRAAAMVDAWMYAHTGWLVWPVVLLGLYLRTKRAAASFFSADEALIIFPPMQRSLAGVYEWMIEHPHGPLPNYLLHFMTYFGSSELYFRIPSVLAGGLVAYAAYRWAAAVFGRAAGLATAGILAFSPALIVLSAQVRFYTIAMLFMAVSLDCLERAFRECSVKWMRLFGAAILLALLSEYMAVWYIAAVGLYVLARILIKRELPPRLVREWVGTQAAAALVLLVAWVTHLHKLQVSARGREAEQFARDGWLKWAYFHPKSQTAAAFVGKTTRTLFDYMFANHTIGKWMMAVFLLGIVAILLGQAAVPERRRMPVLSLVLPFVVAIAVALMGIYPFGGSRHNAYLCVFLAAGISAAIAAVTRGRVLPVAVAAAVLVPFWLAAERHNGLDDLPQVSKLEQMQGAMEYLATRTPPVKTVVVDQLGNAETRVYVCRGQTEDRHLLTPKLEAMRCGGYEFLIVQDWEAPPDQFPDALARARAWSPGLFPDPAFVFYLSPTLKTDETIVDENRAHFGRIEAYRISP